MYGCFMEVVSLIFLLRYYLICVFMARRAIPMIAFHGVESIYYNYIFLRPLARVCVVYIVKEVASFGGT